MPGFQMAAIKGRNDGIRYGIGEWFGHSFIGLSVNDRQSFAKHALESIKKANQKCPFKSYDGSNTLCNKKGGICTFRQYKREMENQLSDKDKMNPFQTWLDAKIGYLVNEAHVNVRTPKNYVYNFYNKV